MGYPLNNPLMRDLIQIGVVDAISGDVVMTQVGCRAANLAVQTFTTGVWATVLLPDEQFDTDGMHFTSAANLTGTVATAAGSPTITGTGTLFTTELSVGQVIMIPAARDGTNPAWCVVTAITSPLLCTVAPQTQPGSAQTGKTATRVNGAMVARAGGFFDLKGLVTYTNATAGYANAVLCVNGDETTGFIAQAPANRPATTYSASVLNTPWLFAQWDFVQIRVFQNSGVDLITAQGAGGVYLSMMREGS